MSEPSKLPLIVELSAKLAARIATTRGRRQRKAKDALMDLRILEILLDGSPVTARALYLFRKVSDALPRGKPRGRPADGPIPKAGLLLRAAMPAGAHSGRGSSACWH